MKLSTADLEALAKLYGATIHQIQMPPDAAEMVARMDSVQDILSGLPKKDLDAWIAIGNSLLRR